MSKKACVTPQNNLLYVTKHFRCSDAETSALMLQHTYTHTRVSSPVLHRRSVLLGLWRDFASCFLYQAC